MVDAGLARGTRRSRLELFLDTRLGVLAVVAAAFLVALAHGVAHGIVYDANNYWLGSRALLTGGDDLTVGRLDLRGVWTTVVYLPAAALSLLFGSHSAVVLVLIQDAVMIALLTAVVLPRLLELVVRRHWLHAPLSAVVGAFLLSGFTPYPLMDVWALALVLAGVLLLCSGQRWWTLLVGGVLLGVAINLRPAYLAPVALMLVVWLVWHWRRLAWPVVGIVSTLVPQLIVTGVTSGRWLPWPALTAYLTTLQSAEASYVVRYDTVAFHPEVEPQLAYCEPAYATRLTHGRLPDSTTHLVRSYLTHAPDSLRFVAEKVSASMFWSWQTPYAAPAPAGFSVLTPIVVIVTVVGILAMIRRLTLRPARSTVLATVSLIAVWAGSLGTLVLSTPETRFALPLLVVSFIGCLLLVPSPDGSVSLRAGSTVVWAGGAVVLIAVVLVFGALGVAHPAPPGAYTLHTCAGLAG